MQTAKLISTNPELSVQTDKRLRERHLGSLQSLTKKEFRCQHKEEWEKFDSGDPDYCLPGGESARQRYERTVTCVGELAKLLTGQTILIVAHGGVLNGLFYKSISIPLTEPRRFSLFNAAINSFSICGDSWRLDTWGEISHLQELNTLNDN